MAAMLLGAWVPGAAAQEDELTPAQVKELLKDAQRMMGQAEALLHERSVEKAEKREKDAADKLDEVIKKARSSAARDRQSPQARKQPAGKNAQPRNSATRSDDPKRADEPSKFKSVATKTGTWGRLPPEVRRAMLAASKEEVPPEFQELWKRYFESLEKSGK